MSDSVPRKPDSVPRKPGLARQFFRASTSLKPGKTSSSAIGSLPNVNSKSPVVEQMQNTNKLLEMSIKNQTKINVVLQHMFNLLNENPNILGSGTGSMLGILFEVIGDIVLDAIKNGWIYVAEIMRRTLMSVVRGMFASVGAALRTAGKWAGAAGAVIARRVAPALARLAPRLLGGLASGPVGWGLLAGSVAYEVYNLFSGDSETPEGRSRQERARELIRSRGDINLKVLMSSGDGLLNIGDIVSASMLSSLLNVPVTELLAQSDQFEQVDAAPTLTLEDLTNRRNGTTPHPAEPTRPLANGTRQSGIVVGEGLMRFKKLIFDAKIIRFVEKGREIENQVGGSAPQISQTGYQPGGVPSIMRASLGGATTRGGYGGAMGGSLGGGAGGVPATTGDISTIMNAPSSAAPPPASRQDAFKTVADAAQQAGSPDPSLTASIAMLESGWLSSRMAREANNPFGQTITRSQIGSNGIVGGTTGADGQLHAVYDSLESAMRHHVSKWSPRYVQGNPAQSLVNMVQGGYNTINPQWAPSVASIYQRMNGQTAAGVPQSASAGAALNSSSVNQEAAGSKRQQYSITAPQQQQTQQGQGATSAQSRSDTDIPLNQLLMTLAA